VTRCRAGSGNSHHVGDCGGERRRAAMAGQTAGWGGVRAQHGLSRARCNCSELDCAWATAVMASDGQERAGAAKIKEKRCLRALVPGRAGSLDRWIGLMGVTAERTRTAEAERNRRCRRGQRIGLVKRDRAA
jgi:hypothetical protein